MMIKNILKKIKLRKYKDIFLIDSENVGYKLPEILPKTTLVYLFLSEPSLIEKFKQENLSQVIIVDLYSILHKKGIKNAMDFCIVVKLRELINLTHYKQNIIIASKDKGYDCAIDYILKNHSQRKIKRFPFSIENYYTIQDTIYPKDSHIIDLIPKYSSMESLKRNLSKKQRKTLYTYYYKNNISGFTVIVEYDFYNNCYNLYTSGKIKDSYHSKAEAYQIFTQLSQEMELKYAKYQTRELFIKARQLNIHPYIEESYLKNVSLQQCLIQHFGNQEGINLYMSFIH